MGANLQTLELTATDFGGARYEGCIDALCLTRPDAPGFMHHGFLDAGCDVIETNTFQASRLAPGGVGPGRQDATPSTSPGAAIARRECDDPEQPGRPAAVCRRRRSGRPASCPRPTIRRCPTFASRSWSRFSGSRRGALVEGGADLLIIETQQDILETKAAIAGARRCFARQRAARCRSRSQVSLDTNGRMLLGTDVGAALAILEGLRRRRDRPQLLDRARAHARADPLPGPEHAASRSACIPNAGHPDQPGRRQGALSARAGRPGRGAGRVRRGLRRQRRRRLLRHHASSTCERWSSASAARAPRPRRGRPRCRAPPARCAASTCARTRRRRWSASGSTRRAAARSSACCWPTTTTAFSAWRATRSKAARTCWTCAWR